ncbi:MAG: hypothetical protein COB46_05505 [Rhodospirillaceae bacterium]|nr:MAG: hypothetical protein COB46_05505 [Rhodospirillaceae bacterium]
MSKQLKYQYSGTRDGKVKMYGTDDFLQPIYHKFGERFFQYRKDWDETGQGGTALRDFPLFLDIEPEYKCNLRCVTCPHQYGTKNPTYINNRMTPEDFRKICEEAGRYGMPAISVSNNNEGLMQKHLFDYIDAASSNGIMDIFVGTNAHLLTEEVSRKLIGSGLTRLLVSIDAATPETYQIMRKSEKFDLVIENTKTFKRLRDEMGESLPLLRVSMVVTSLNQHEEQAFRDMWTDVADIVSIQHYIPFKGEADAKDDLVPQDRPHLENPICTPLWQRMSIRANGDVIACCHLANKLKVGNVFESDIHTIWHGPEMSNIRRIHAEGRYKDISICKSCMS